MMSVQVKEFFALAGELYPASPRGGGWLGQKQAVLDAWQRYLTRDAAWPTLQQARDALEAWMARPKKGAYVPRLNEFAEMLEGRSSRPTPVSSPAGEEEEYRRQLEREALEAFEAAPQEEQEHWLATIKVGEGMEGTRGHRVMAAWYWRNHNKQKKAW